MNTAKTKPLGQLIPRIDAGKQIGLELTIKPVGETDAWHFTTGSFCGQAMDSVGITMRGTGCTMLRKDVKALRELLQWAEENWSAQPSYEDL